MKNREIVSAVHVNSHWRNVFAGRLMVSMERHGPFKNDRERLLFAQQNIGLFEQCFPEVRRRIEAVRELLLIQGLPSSESDDDPELSRIVSLMISLSINRGFSPYQFHQDKGGDLVSLLVTKREPSPADFANGLKRLPHHVDFADSGNTNGRPDLDGRPHFLTLGGVRNFGAETTYTSIADVIRCALSPQDIDKLSRSDFVSPVSPLMNIGELNSGPMPVLWQSGEGKPAVTLRATTRPLLDNDMEGVAVLCKLREALVAHEYGFKLDHGVYAVVSNLHGTHSRKEMPGEGSRVLLRVYTGPVELLRSRTNVFDMKQVFDYHGSDSM